MSERINDGGPAFPVANMASAMTHQDDEARAIARGAITLRDYLAAKALPECLVIANHQTPHGGELSELFAKAAIYAYYAADAMIKARES